MYEGPVPRGGRVLWGGAILAVSMCHPTHFPTDKLSVSFSRSSGPGGQNVNKGSVAERSKALVLGTSHGSGVGSNPTAARLFFFFHSSFFHTIFSTEILVIIVEGFVVVRRLMMYVYAFCSKHEGGREVACGLCRVGA